MATRIVSHTRSVQHPVAVQQEDVYQTNEVANDNHGTNVLARVVWLIADLLLILLAFRFVLALLGANPSNAFANFIYDVSYPFVAPFFGLFSYNYHYGVSRFETYTLVAMLVYAVLAWMIVRLVTIDKDESTE